MNDDDPSGGLLLGALALRMGLLAPDALASALGAWAAGRDRSLGQVLEDLGMLPAKRRQLLEELAAERGTPARQAREEASLPTRQPSTAPGAEAGAEAGARFRILRPHAKGGLGQVSVAFDEELRREVALKEIQVRHADVPNRRARFLVEAEITGGLEHPGIVPVYALGRHADGRPFYAMRFIRGDSLKEALGRLHAAETPRFAAPEARAALRRLVRRLIDVCNAVAYAHSRGVIHRDLKPGNVMLGPFGETLVVDWGLARTFDRARSGPDVPPPLRPLSLSDLAPTRPGEAVGTPGYMPPEQAAGRLDDLGPGADVFSLGATLYHVLTGQPPFADPDPGQVFRQTLRGEFPTPRRLDPSIPPALEAVCVQALAARPEDRHASAGALADALDGWLMAEATPPAPPARRWPWAAAIASLVAAAALVLLVFVVGQYRSALEETKARAEERAWEERDNALAAQQAVEEQRRIADEQKRIADAERNRTREEEGRLRRLADFLAGMFEVRTPREPAEGFPGIVGDWEGRLPFDGLMLRAGKAWAGKLTARDALLTATGRLERLASDPVLASVVRAALGNALRHQGQYAQAQELLLAALDVRHHRPADHPDVAAAQLYLARLHLDRDEPAEAARLAGEAHRVASGLPADQPLARDARLVLAWCRVRRGDAPGAETLLAAHQPKRRPGEPEEEAEVVALRLALAERYLREGRFAPALAHAGRVLLGLFRFGGPFEEATLFDALRALSAHLAGRAARLYGEAGLPVAEVLQRHAHAGATRCLGEGHPFLIPVQHELALVLEAAGRAAEAGRAYQTLVELIRGSVGLEALGAHPAVESCAWFLARQGRYAESKALYQELANARGERFDYRHPSRYAIARRFALLAERHDDLKEAEDRYRFLYVGADDDRGTGLEQSRIEVERLLRARQTAKAEKAVKDRLAQVTRQGSEPARARAEVLQAAVHLDAGREQEAGTLLAGALPKLGRGEATLHWVIEALLLEARLARGRGDASRKLDEAIALADRAKDYPVLRVRAGQAQARLLLQQGETARAQALLEQAVALASRECGEASPAAARARGWLNLALLRAGRAEEVLRRLDAEVKRPESKPKGQGGLLRALALHRLGRAGDARAALAQAVKALDARAAEGWPRDEWLELQRLRGEIEEVLKN